MYILEIPQANKRREIILYIVNSIFHTSFHTLEKALALPGFSYLEHSEKTKTKSIGINDLSQIKKNLSLRPEISPKLAIINNAQSLTSAAQNALLKDLEEESRDSIFILATSDNRLLLPTIISRGICIKSNQISLIDEHIVQEKFSDLVYNGQDNIDLGYIEEFLHKDLYDKLKYAHTVLEKEQKKDGQNIPEVEQKEDLVESFLIDLLLYYERILLSESNILLQKDIELVEKGIEKIRIGVNKKAVLEHIILTIHHG